MLGALEPTGGMRDKSTSTRVVFTCWLGCNHRHAPETCVSAAHKKKDGRQKHVRQDQGAVTTWRHECGVGRVNHSIIVNKQNRSRHALGTGGGTGMGNRTGRDDKSHNKGMTVRD